MQTANPAPFLTINALHLTGTESPARPVSVTITASGWDGTAELVSLTATIQIPALDPQNTFENLQRDFVARLHAMLDPALLRL